MMIKYIAVLALCCTTLLGAQGIEISRLTGNYYVYTTYNDFAGKPFPSNSMYIVTDDGVVLLDTPWKEELTLPLLDSIRNRHGKEVVMCIATHSHEDRTAGLGVLNKKGIKTYTSKQTYDLCKKNNEKLPSSFFTRDTVFTVGGHRIETFYPGAGHTEDNIVIWLPKEEILYGGCFVKSTDNNSLGNIEDADLKAWPHSIKRVIRRYSGPKHVVPGHFAWKDKSALKHTARLLKSAQ